MRSKVRRGLRRCEVRPLPFADIAAHGLAADRETLARQGRAVRLERPKPGSATGRRRRRLPGWRGGARSSADDLAAFLVSVQFDDSVEFLLARSRSDASRRVSEQCAHLHGDAEHVGANAACAQITFGLESLEPVGPLDQFKFSMGFRARAAASARRLPSADRVAVAQPARLRTRRARLAERARHAGRRSGARRRACCAFAEAGADVGRAVGGDRVNAVARRTVQGAAVGGQRARWRAMNGPFLPFHRPASIRRRSMRWSTPCAPDG